MAFVSVTRLRVRSGWILPGFFWTAFRTMGQAQKAGGNLGATVRNLPRRVFWTMTIWRDEAAMRAYRDSNPHAKAMPKLVDWCDEASIAHWTQDDEALPDWGDAEVRMRAHGRLSRVRKPSPAHQAGSPIG